MDEERRCRDFIHRFGRYALAGARGSTTSVSRAAYTLIHTGILALLLASQRYHLAYITRIHYVHTELCTIPWHTLGYFEILQHIFAFGIRTEKYSGIALRDSALQAFKGGDSSGRKIRWGWITTVWHLVIEIIGSWYGNHRICGNHRIYGNHRILTCITSWNVNNQCISIHM